MKKEKKFFLTEDELNVLRGGEANVNQILGCCSPNTNCPPLLNVNHEEGCSCNCPEY